MLSGSRDYSKRTIHVDTQTHRLLHTRVRKLVFYAQSTSAVISGRSAHTSILTIHNSIYS